MDAQELCRICRLAKDGCLYMRMRQPCPHLNSEYAGSGGSFLFNRGGGSGGFSSPTRFTPNGVKYVYSPDVKDLFDITVKKGGLYNAY